MATNPERSLDERFYEQIEMFNDFPSIESDIAEQCLAEIGEYRQNNSKDELGYLELAIPYLPPTFARVEIDEETADLGNKVFDWRYDLQEATRTEDPPPHFASWLKAGHAVDILFSLDSTEVPLKLLDQIMPIEPIVSGGSLETIGTYYFDTFGVTLERQMIYDSTLLSNFPIWWDVVYEDLRRRLPRVKPTGLIIDALTEFAAIVAVEKLENLESRTGQPHRIRQAYLEKTKNIALRGIADGLVFSGFNDLIPRQATRLAKIILNITNLAERSLQASLKKS